MDQDRASIEGAAGWGECRAWAIQDPDGRILMRYIGPHAHLLKAEFTGYNKRIDWNEGYSCIRVIIEKFDWEHGDSWPPT